MNIKSTLILLLLIALYSCKLGKPLPKAELIPYNKSDYNGVFTIDSIDGKEFTLLQHDYSEAYKVSKKDAVEISNIKKATIQFSDIDNSPEISIELDAIGTKKIAELTSKNIGKKLPVIFHNKLLICPIVRAEITGGRLTISSSNLSLQELVNLAAYINQNNK